MISITVNVIIYCCYPPVWGTLSLLGILLYRLLYSVFIFIQSTVVLGGSHYTLASTVFQYKTVPDYLERSHNVITRIPPRQLYKLCRRLYSGTGTWCLLIFICPPWSFVSRVPLKLAVLACNERPSSMLRYLCWQCLELFSVLPLPEPLFVFVRWIPAFCCKNPKYCFVTFEIFYHTDRVNYVLLDISTISAGILIITTIYYFGSSPTSSPGVSVG